MWPAESRSLQALRLALFQVALPMQHKGLARNSNILLQLFA